jgi:hypothetical protein
MEFEVELWGMGNLGEIRKVDVPADELTGDTISDCELVFKYGQNDFQPQENCRSVSVGDVIRIPVGENIKLYKVAMVGFVDLVNHSFYHDHVQAMIRQFKTFQQID